MVQLEQIVERRDGHACPFDIEGFEHAVRLWTIVLEISVLMAAFPSKRIARLSYEYRLWRRRIG